MTAPLSALLVSYIWPPTGGVGVQRVLKLAKYLPDHGVTPSVLTVANPSMALSDPSLARDIPRDLEVLQARTFEPGYEVKQALWDHARASVGRQGLMEGARRRLASAARRALVPDPQVLWQPDAQRALLRRLRQRRDDVVMITAPPFSAFLSAPLVRAFRRPALVLDYRDEWLTLRTQYEMLSSRRNAIVSGALENGLLRLAHVVTVAASGFRDELLSRFSFLDPGRVVTIPNGYDPEDVPGDLASRRRPPADRFVLTYAGTIFRQNSPRGLLGALRLLHEREPDLARHLSVRFIGRIVETELDAFEGSEAFGVSRQPFMDRAQVIPELAASHMTLCLLDTMPGAERIYPGKVFELMALGRPCLTIAPPGALADLARHHQIGPVLPPRDIPAIADALATALRAWRAGTFEVDVRGVGIGRYDRRIIAGEFAALFRQVSATRR